MSSDFDDWVPEPQTPEVRAMFASLRQALADNEPPKIRDGIHRGFTGKPVRQVVLTSCREKWTGWCGTCGERFTALPPYQYLERRSDGDAFQTCPACAEDTGFGIDPELARELEPVPLSRI